MDEPNNDGNGAVEAEASVLLENGEPVAAVVSLPESDTETGGDDSGEQSDAVTITQIEAEKEIAIAAIEADVETARIEAEQERVEKWDEARITELETNTRELNDRLTETLDLLKGLVNPAPSIPTSPEEPAQEAEAIETALEPNSIPTSIVENETVTELGADAGAESVVAVAVAEAAPVKRRRRLI